MNRVCKYYLKGKCLYGDRCHFLHVINPGYNTYNRYDTNYSNSDYDRKSYDNYSQSSARNCGYTYYNNNQQQNVNFNRNYNKYHVDHRQIPKPDGNSSEVTPDFILEVTREELQIFTLGKVWPLTVISIGGGYGNLPGYKDHSPEEIHYQYYESVRHNTIQEFEESMKLLHDNVKNMNQLFGSNSAEVKKIVEGLLQNFRSGKVINAYGGQIPNSTSSAASTFSFTLEEIPGVKSTECMNTDIPNFSTFSVTSANNFGFALVNNQTQTFLSNQFNNSQAFSFNSYSAQRTERSQISSSSDSNEIPFQSMFDDTSPVQREYDGLYSNVENLSDNVLKSFQAKVFTMGNVPLAPPPKKFC